MTIQQVIKIAAGVSFGILLTLTPASAKQKGAQEPKAVQEIRQVLASQVAAWNHRDLEGFMKGYWRSPELTFYSGGTIVSGWEETLARYRNRYQSAGKEMGKLEFGEMKFELLGRGAAFVRGQFHLKMDSSESDGLFTLTFRKFLDGWKIIHDHTSTAP